MRHYWSAVPGSYDQSALVNPETGAFRYPKYRSPKSAIVKIADKTNYREDFDPIDGLKPNLFDFEYRLTDYLESDDYCCLELEVSYFDDVFDLIVRRAELSPKLMGMGSELISLANDDDWFSGDQIAGLPEGFEIFCEGERRLLEAGLLQTYPVEPGSPLESIVQNATLESLTAAQLKEICDRDKLPKTGKKDELLARVRAANSSLPLPPVVKLNTRKLESLLDVVTDVYISDIRQSIDRWHPLVIPQVWRETLHNSDCPILTDKIKAILAEPYWADRLTKVELN
jgi:hypothetical protein